MPYECALGLWLESLHLILKKQNHLLSNEQRDEGFAFQRDVILTSRTISHLCIAFHVSLWPGIFSKDVKKKKSANTRKMTFLKKKYVSSQDSGVMWTNFWPPTAQNTSKMSTTLPIFINAIMCKSQKGKKNALVRVFPFFMKDWRKSVSKAEIWPRLRTTKRLC